MKGIDPAADHTAMLSFASPGCVKGSLGRSSHRGSPWDDGNVCAASWTMQTQFCSFWEQNKMYDWNPVATEIQEADMSSEVDGVELAHDFLGWTCWFKTLSRWRVQIPIKSNPPMYSRGEIITGCSISLRIKPNSHGIFWGAAEIFTWQETISRRVLASREGSSAPLHCLMLSWTEGALKPVYRLCIHIEWG